MERQTLAKGELMKDLISVAILIATVFGGTVAAEKIYNSVRVAALTKAATGLPVLLPFAASLTRKQNRAKYITPAKIGSTHCPIPAIGTAMTRSRQLATHRQKMLIGRLAHSKFQCLVDFDKTPRIR